MINKPKYRTVQTADPKAVPYAKQRPAACHNQQPRILNRF
jgi:hypothetical protein